MVKIFVALAIGFSGISSFAKAPVLTPEKIASPPPKIIRTCCAFGANIGFAGVPFAKKTDITSVGTMGPHGFLGGKEEKNGNIYTRRGGFIDLGHLRDCADWTAYLYNLIQASKSNRELVVTHIGNEGGEKTLVIRIPENIDDEDARELAGKIAYDFSVWHEIATWFGASYVPMVPERYSSFSPEDLYSNLLGVHLGMMAIKSDLDYDEAMTELLAEMLYELECVDTEQETLDAMLKVDNLWYTSHKRFPNKKILLKRYFDPESELIPWIIPDEYGILQPFILQKPDAKLSDLYQFSIKLNFRFPVKEIFTEESDRIVTQKDFDILMQFIHDELNRYKEVNDKHSTKEEKAENKKRSKKNKFEI